METLESYVRTKIFIKDLRHINLLSNTFGNIPTRIFEHHIYISNHMEYSWKSKTSAILVALRIEFSLEACVYIICSFHKGHAKRRKGRLYIPVIDQS